MGIFPNIRDIYSLRAGNHRGLPVLAICSPVGYTGNKGGGSMKKTVYILLILALTVGTFFLGRVTAPQTNSVTFYAVITQKSGDHLIVEGIPENDINHRWQFQFTLEEKVPIIWRGVELTVDDLKWLYTAMTRATEKVYLVNFKDELFID